MAKRGRPIKPDAKRNGLNIRFGAEENDMLLKLSELTGKTRTEVFVDSLRQEYNRVVRNNEK